MLYRPIRRVRITLRNAEKERMMTTTRSACRMLEYLVLLTDLVIDSRDEDRMDRRRVPFDSTLMSISKLRAQQQLSADPDAMEVS